MMWMSVRMALLVAAVSWFPEKTAAGDDAGSSPDGFLIPTSHPRLWWTPERVAKAKRFTQGGDDPFSNAMNYVLTGKAGYARAAIHWLVKYTIPQAQLDGVASDDARWNGENAILTYDWCYDRMTAEERTRVLDRWNGYLDTLSKKGWGGIGFDANNYYWGYLRNELEWGIATYHENPKAQAFLDHALVARWKNSFLPYAAGSGNGGVLAEGPGYGAVLPWYGLIPFTTMRLLGRDPYEETDFFKGVVCYILYATTPAPTSRKGDDFASCELFPFSDEEYPEKAHVFTERKYYGDFMTVFADQWRDRPLGQYARHWLNWIRPAVSGFVRAVDQKGTEKEFSSLPLDYFAPGIAYLYTRNQWGPRSTAIQLQLGRGPENGHFHRDFGTFQIWRNGRWLTRETTGYAQDIIGYGGKKLDVGFPDAHNSILVGPSGNIAPLENRGVARAYWKGPPVVLRLESRPNYSYAVVDLSHCFQATDHADLFSNPYVKSVVREFLFLRSLETLVILDRVESTGHGAVSANDVTRTCLLHFERQPKIEGDSHVLAINGNQALEVTTLVPAKPVYRVTDEGVKGVGQYRLEVETKGSAAGYLLHVLQGRDAKGTGLTAKLSEDDKTFTVTLELPPKDKTVIVFQKGVSSVGGSVDGSPLTDHVQHIEVTDAGPVWE